jgi:hypothetical protein
MPQTFFRTALLDDKETEIEVEIAVHTWGCSAHMGSMSYAGHPAEGPEVEIVDAWLLEETNLPKAPSILASLTDAERERIETEFCEDPPEPDCGDDY